MNTFDQKIIDSHLHLDHVHTHHPDRIRWMRVRGILPISWAFAIQTQDMRSLKAYLRTQANVIRHLNEEGLKCFFLSGIHPRNISPDIRAEDVRELLSPFLEDPLCLGIGEIGLETGSQQEKEIFSAHLELGDMVRTMGKRIGIHTPKSDKPEMTQATLALLEAYPGIGDMTVIDHCTPETIGQILERGYWAGITLSPAKASLRNLEQIVSRHSKALKRIMCNTDSGTVFYEDIYELYASDALLPEVRNGLVFKNACRFFGLEGGPEIGR